MELIKYKLTEDQLKFLRSDFEKIFLKLTTGYYDSPKIIWENRRSTLSTIIGINIHPNEKTLIYND